MLAKHQMRRTRQEMRDCRSIPLLCFPKKRIVTEQKEYWRSNVAEERRRETVFHFMPKQECHRVASSSRREEHRTNKHLIVPTWPLCRPTVMDSQHICSCMGHLWIICCPSMAVTLGICVRAVCMACTAALAAHFL